MTIERNDNWAKGPVGWILTILGSVIASAVILFMTSAYASMLRTESRLTALETAGQYQKQSFDSVVKKVDTLIQVQLYKASGMSIDAIKLQVEKS